MVKLFIDASMFIILFVLYFTSNDISTLIGALYFAGQFNAEINVLRILEKIK